VREAHFRQQLETMRNMQPAHEPDSSLRPYATQASISTVKHSKNSCLWGKLTALQRKRETIWRMCGNAWTDEAQKAANSPSRRPALHRLRVTARQAERRAKKKAGENSRP